MSDEDDEIVLQLADPPNCARCEGPGLLSARFSHSWKNACGEEIPGVREAMLCPACDHGEPGADGLLAFFEVHETMGAFELEAFNNLAAAWLAVVRARQADEHRLDDECERFRNGDL
ncbi:DUF6300 family protein [Streptomyces sp. NBC_00316]|uniref:DUF6300 family protein n=1 Tax=Streptomyces sp. NBC_00316 TaxID=2975710 RepID=UPI002E2D4C6F|nr:DUF6300 family protein [Streptomyces sp. NBC_00316]